MATAHRFALLTAVQSCRNIRRRSEIKRILVINTHSDENT